MLPKFRSKFEREFWLKTKLPYETTKLKFKQPESQHTYTPDFIIPNTNIVLELKGIFDVLTRQKMVLVKEQHPHLRIILIFYKKNCKISRTSKTTYEEWCDKHGLEYKTIEEVIQIINLNK